MMGTTVTWIAQITIAGMYNTCEVELLLFVISYYRFSSRMRHKTDFYISTQPEDVNGDDGSMRGRDNSNRGTRRKVPSVARKLSFENYVYQTPLVTAKPDILDKDSDSCCLEVKSGKNIDESKSVKEDVPTKVGRTLSKSM